MGRTGYLDQKWSGGTPVDGEQLSVNGYYIGEHIGTPMQDAISPVANEDPHYTQHVTYRHGTITQDAAPDANMPEKATAPSVSTASLAAGTVGTPYDQTLTGSGTTPLQWTIESGELPTGLILDMGTGKITGTPTVEETKTFTVKGSNMAGGAVKELSITINAGE